METSTPHTPVRRLGIAFPPVPWWRLLGFGVFALLVCRAIVSGSTLASFIDVPSLYIAAGCSVFILLGIFGWSGTRDAFLTLLLGSSPARNAERAISYFRLGAALSLASGFLGTLIGLVKMLQNVEDPSQLGAGMAVALLTQLYGVVLAILSYSAGAIIASRSDAPDPLSELSRRSVPAAGAAAAVGIMTVFIVFLLLLALTEL